MRTFETGATRDTDNGKLDYEGFLHPDVLERFAEYMHENRIQADGGLRTADNWQKGIPRKEYMKSAWRHFHEWWKLHRLEMLLESESLPPRLRDDMEDALCAMMFNTMGYMFELMNGR
jgi:hypothetical protein